MSESVSVKKKKKSPKQSTTLASSESFPQDGETGPGKSNVIDDDPKSLDILRELESIKNHLKSIMESQATMQESMKSGGMKATSSMPKLQAPPSKSGPSEKQQETSPAAKDTPNEDGLKKKSKSKESQLLLQNAKSLESDLYDDGLSKGDLERTLLLAESVQEKKNALAEAKSHGCGAYLKFKWERRTSEQAEILLESAMGWVICVNAIYIGLAMDMESADEPIWIVLNLTFSAIFIAELVFKISFLGPKKYFSNSADVFDTILVLVDLVQLVLDQTVWDADENNSDLPSASLFRLIRLAKLTRLLRLLRNEVFKDLLAMIQGMIGGMPTLMWAQVLFLLCIYVMALLFRELLGRDEVEHVKEYFNNVPRSIFTTFRCSFGDCSARGGVPIFEFVYDSYSGWMTVLYCLFTFATVVGLFNVVSAIFVETTMAAAMRLAREKKEKKLRDPDIWSSCVAFIIRRIMESLPDQDEALLATDLLSDQVDAIREMQVPNTIIDKLIKSKDIEDAFFHLGVDPDDNEYLSDILDPDNGGNINVHDLVDGIRRLRGEPKRSDIVSIDMMVRATQLKVDEVLHWMSAKDEAAFHAKTHHVHEHHHHEPVDIPHLHLHHSHNENQNAPPGEDLEGAPLGEHSQGTE